MTDLDLSSEIKMNIKIIAKDNIIGIKENILIVIFFK